MKAKEYLKQMQIEADSILFHSCTLYYKLDELMEDYAKQEAIEFTKYMLKKYPDYMPDDKIIEARYNQKFKDDDRLR
jgi:hypothetical protein